MKASKFPVISENGNEYLVRIKKSIEYHTYHIEDVIICAIYVKRKFNLFGYQKVYGMSVYYNNWNDSIIELCKESVKQYEKEHVLPERKYKQSLEEFEKWNGKC